MESLAIRAILSAANPRYHCRKNQGERHGSPAQRKIGPDADVLSEIGKGGMYTKQPSLFRNRITADGSSGYPAQSGRYHLYCAVSCPWAHRAVLYRVLKKLEPHIALHDVAQIPGGQGWAFDETGHVVPGNRQARALPARDLCDRRCGLHLAGHRADAVGCANAQHCQQREFGHHPHVQCGICECRRSEPRSLSRTFARRNRRDERFHSGRRQQCDQRLRALGVPGSL